MYNVRNEGKTVPGLLPELTRRGMVDPIETVIDAVGTVVSSLYMSSPVLTVLVFGQLGRWGVLDYANTWCKSRHTSMWIVVKNTVNETVSKRRACPVMDDS